MTIKQLIGSSDVRCEREWVWFRREWDSEIMFSLEQKYSAFFLRLMLIGIALVFLQLLSFDVMAAGRLETIANGIVAGSSEKIKQLQMIAVYGSAILLLLVLLNMVRNKNRGKKLMALLALQLLANAMVIYHIA